MHCQADSCDWQQGRYIILCNVIAVAVWLLHSHYQLVWMTDAEVASNIIMSSITSPFLFVLNPQTHEYYLLDESTIQQLTVDAVVDFFDNISDGSRQVYLSSSHLSQFMCMK